MNKKGKFIYSAVLCIYLLYALLPLLYSTRSENAKDPADYAYISLSAVQRTKQNLLLLPAEVPSSASDADVLLKKKRAIAPSFKDTVAKLFPQYVRFSHFEPSFKISFVPLQIPDHTLSCPEGFPYYHSGTSPPSA
jgi:hypothetical protein